MHLETLRLVNFKNYKNSDFRFNSEINCLVGENGVGKTNVLDAIHYLSIGKSAFNLSDHQVILHGELFFALNGYFIKNQKSFKVKCSGKLNQKKSFSVNDQEYDKIKDYIGTFPVVMISPNDTDIIRGGSENRRRFIDAILAQLDAIYLGNLLRYNHALKQRNALLKKVENANHLDKDLLASYDKILIHTGEEIHRTRKYFVDKYAPLLRKQYVDISDGKESIDVGYQSDLNEKDFSALLKGSIKKDLILKRTTCGIHRDDYLFDIDGFPVKKFASQGQQKSLTVSLKIAQFELMRSEQGFKSILLMDDVFDKLDDPRIEKVMNLVAGHTFGQIFVTDARPERTLTIFDSIKSNKSIFHIQDGGIEILSP